MFLDHETLLTGGDLVDGFELSCIFCWADVYLYRHCYRPFASSPQTFQTSKTVKTPEMLIVLQGKACNKPSQSFQCQEKAPFVYLGAFSVIVKSSRMFVSSKRDGAIAFRSNSSSSSPASTLKSTSVQHTLISTQYL